MELHEGVRVVAMEAGRLLLESQPPEAFDECLWCTQAAAPAWLRQTGLTLGTPVAAAVPGTLLESLWLQGTWGIQCP